MTIDKQKLIWYTSKRKKPVRIEQSICQRRNRISDLHIQSQEAMLYQHNPPAALFSSLSLASCLLQITGHSLPGLARYSLPGIEERILSLLKEQQHEFSNCENTGEYRQIS